jgi:hypothetical protein
MTLTETETLELPAPEHYVIPTDLAQGLLNYLARHPYGEVSGLIQGLQSMKAALIEEDRG